ncbi:MAG: chemotaxis protein methyltransferase CheR [Thermoleophilaceae bacterium]|jgi:chemotaxis protein methyltransferase CheR|nr:chemotaxis protein methyltransferase CheR [Thermoleophilaceae bacterium]
MAIDDLARASDDLERIEVQVLLEAIYQHYGFDFRGYALGSLKRRLWRRAYAEKVETMSALQDRVLHDHAVMERLLLDLSINVTSMFRDPSFFQALRQKVVPLLRTYPFMRIWNAGCSTGEETFSLAILLREEGLYDRARIYATDINDSVLEQARAGVFPLEKMRDYTENYIRAGGTESFSSYYTADGDSARFSPDLLEQVVFAQHNLVSDAPFNEFNVIVCRNVMIYFGKSLQNRVHELFYESLDPFGILALGHKESIKFTKYEERYEALDAPEKLYRKMY